MSAALQRCQPQHYRSWVLPLGDTGLCLPCSMVSCQLSSPCQTCRGFMPWFTLKLLMLLPLLCLFLPVVMILQSL